MVLMSGLSLLLLSRCLRKDDERKTMRTSEGGGGEDTDISLLKGNESKRWCNRELCQAINNTVNTVIRWPVGADHLDFTLLTLFVLSQIHKLTCM